MFLTQDALNSLKEYFKIRNEPATPEDWKYVLLSFGGGKLHESTIYDIVKKAAVRAGIQMSVYPHLFRHTTLTDLGMKGANDWGVQKFAGHAPQSLMRYAHPQEHQIKEEVLTHPFMVLDSKAPARMVRNNLILTQKLATGEIYANTYRAAVGALTPLNEEVVNGWI